MQDLGIRVLFMGDNFARLLSGLWVTVRISLISVVLSIILGVLLGMVMTIKNLNKNLFGICKNYATACFTVFSLFRFNKIFRNKFIRGSIFNNCIYNLGNC